MKLINVVAKWQGSIHDARILRESDLFQRMENGEKVIDGFLLGDSGYMARDWLLTPLPNPQTRPEKDYNFAQSSTRTTVERTIGVLKNRFHCLKGLHLRSSAKICRVIVVCCMLHNIARDLNLADQNFEGSDESGDVDMGPDPPVVEHQNERSRVTQGKAARNLVISNFFTD